MNDENGTWFDRVWADPAGRLLALLASMLVPLILLDVYGHNPDYPGAALSAVAVWGFLMWRRPPSRRHR